MGGNAQVAQARYDLTGAASQEVNENLRHLRDLRVVLRPAVMAGLSFVTRQSTTVVSTVIALRYRLRRSRLRWSGLDIKAGPLHDRYHHGHCKQGGEDEC